MIYCFVYLRQQQVKIQIRAWSGIRVLARAADRLEPTCLLLEGHTERDRSPYETRRPVLLTFLSTLKFIDESISDVFNRKEVCLSARVGYGCREAVRLSLRTARRSVQTHRTILAREKKKKKTPHKTDGFPTLEWLWLVLETESRPWASVRGETCPCCISCLEN